MDRISLERRLKWVDPFDGAKCPRMGNIPVDEYFDAMEALTGHPLEAKTMAMEHMEALNISSDTPLRDAIGRAMAILTYLTRVEEDPEEERRATELLYALIAEPLYWMYEKEMEKHD